MLMAGGHRQQRLVASDDVVGIIIVFSNIRQADFAAKLRHSGQILFILI